jgi:hypothetical protein
VTGASRLEYVVEPLNSSRDRLAFHSGVPESYRYPDKLFLAMATIEKALNR